MASCPLGWAVLAFARLMPGRQLQELPSPAQGVHAGPLHPLLETLAETTWEISAAVVAD